MTLRRRGGIASLQSNPMTTTTTHGPLPTKFGSRCFLFLRRRLGSASATTTLSCERKAGSTTTSPSKLPGGIADNLSELRTVGLGHVSDLCATVLYDRIPHEISIQLPHVGSTSQKDPFPQMSKSGSLRKKPHSSSPEHTRLHRIYNLILTTSTSTSFSSQAMTSTIGTSAATASRKRMSERTLIGNDDIERKTSTCLKTLHREARKHGEKPWMYQKTTIILAHR